MVVCVACWSLQTTRELIKHFYERDVCQRPIAGCVCTVVLPAVVNNTTLFQCLLVLIVSGVIVQLIDSNLSNLFC